MTELKCSVRDCKNNKDNLCCRPNIIVDGKNARSSVDTGCGSYRHLDLEPGRVAAVSGGIDVGYVSPNRALRVECEAKNCAYYKNELCSADRISIRNGSDGSECATFIEK